MPGLSWRTTLALDTLILVVVVGLWLISDISWLPEFTGGCGTPLDSGCELCETTVRAIASLLILFSVLGKELQGAFLKVFKMFFEQFSTNKKSV